MLVTEYSFPHKCEGRVLPHLYTYHENDVTVITFMSNFI